MKSPDPTFNPAVEEQASLWAARLDGSVLSPDERRALETWLAGDPSHRELLSQYCQLSTDLEQKLPLLAAADGVDLPATPVLRRSRRTAWNTGLALAAAAAIALVFWLKPAPGETKSVATSVAQRQSITLADGTRVDLNAQTSLRVEISGSRRHILLASGEAFFSVHKDPSRPFIVDTPAGSVRVTGTKFDVRTETPTSLEVTVREGSVQAHPGELGSTASAPYALTAGDQLNASPAGVEVHKLSASALDDAFAWREGQVVFNRVPLRDALARFARYQGRGISVSPAVAALSVGGRYSLDDLDGFLASIQEFMPISVSRESNGTIRVSARPGS